MKVTTGIIALSIAFIVAVSGCGTTPKTATAEPAPENKGQSEPTASVTASSGLFSPDGDGKNDSITFTVVVASAAADGSSWRLDVADQDGKAVKAFSSTQYPNGVIAWNGICDSGDPVESAMDYTARLTATDGNGVKATATATFSTDILVSLDGGRSRIMVPSMTFKPYTADFTNVTASERSVNGKTLDTIARILKKRDGQKILIEGYAVSEYWNDEARANRENREELIPLSKARAEAVKNALVSRGAAVASIETIGLGAAKSVVPNSDSKNRWKNRRVEFFLKK